ncbi:ABC transporter substrate-binding protein [Variovorax sp. J31P179]|uniref:ABC transporter substrate-binding protein n=1 Tax=Variovorax sp. J31P179 TaxID=3053508 RepID=UPI00257735FC|nr:ABC transporter substrate-binding protein [Variovorax sp. J31P179]MDM0084621.1 ABC transporter substrate-binding protein [Variovorax sp. J31P179]
MSHPAPTALSTASPQGSLRRRLLLTSAAAFVPSFSAFAQTPAAAVQSRATLRVLVFPGGFNWPLWVAQDLGFFAATGITVHISDTPSSVAQMSSLIDGATDIAMTAADNVIAYREGQGEGRPGHAADVVATMGSDGGFLRLVSAPGITSIAQLRGCRLGVDALTTGYAFVLREIIARHGLGDDDIEWVKAGGVLQRFEAIQRGHIDATLLITPFDRLAGAKGFNLLAKAWDVVGRYQGVVASARRPWAQQHGAELVGFIKASVLAMRWMRSPKNRAKAESILALRMPQMDERDVGALAAALLEAPDGFQTDAGIDLEGVKTVIALRQRHGSAPAALGDTNRYVDASYYQAAISQV